MMTMVLPLLCKPIDDIHKLFHIVGMQTGGGFIQNEKACAPSACAKDMWQA